MIYIMRASGLVHHEIFILETFAVRFRPEPHVNQNSTRMDDMSSLMIVIFGRYVCIIHTVNFLDLSMRNLLIFIVSSFSSPGAGKSTISEEAIRLLRNHDELSKYHVLHLDLDVCVPQWMRVSGLKQPMQHTICRKES